MLSTTATCAIEKQTDFDTEVFTPSIGLDPILQVFSSFPLMPMRCVHLPAMDHHALSL